MAEILLHWLSERLQEDINCNETDNIVEITKDGFVVASLLQSYNIISKEEKVLIVRSDENEIHKRNWFKIAEWLKKVDIYLTNNDLTEIIDGEISIVLRLFWHLFSFFDTKNRSSFIDREKHGNSTVYGKFKRDNISKNIHGKSDSLIIQATEPTDDNLNKWKNMKQRELRTIYDHLRKCDRYSRPAYEHKLPLSKPLRSTNLELKEEFEKINKLNEQFSCKKVNHTYAELEKLNKKAEEMQYFCECDWTREFLGNLERKIKTKKEGDNLRGIVNNITINSKIDQSVAEEELAFDCERTKKLTEMQMFEKQICNIVLENRQQIHDMMHSRVLAQQDFATKRKKQISMFFNNLHEEQLRAKSDNEADKERNQLKLHKVLYQERLKMKREKRYGMCKDILSALIDNLAFKTTVEFGEITDQIIEECKDVLCKCQAEFYDACSKKDSINKLKHEYLFEIDTIVHLVEDNQYIFRDEDFTNYHNKLSPWIPTELITNYDPLNSANHEEYLGGQVLGHVVYSILTVKYPLPSVIPPADVPKFSVAAVVIDVPDNFTVDAMQILLKHKNVTVICLEDAVNYCLNVYKSELAGLDDEMHDNISNFFLSRGDSKHSMWSIETIKEKEYSPNAPDNTKYTQTPKTLPEENVVLSSAAELGRYAYESFSSDRTPTDYLIVAIIIEYLKSLQESKGFVLINYPHTYRQAKILEETLTGKCMPRESVLLNPMDHENSRERKSDPDEHLRKSKLVDDPHKNNLDVQYKTYFTAYIKLKSTFDEAQEPRIWDVTKENSTNLDRFYADQGCNYSLYYNGMTKDILSKICRFVIGDFTLPLKNFDELFGEDVFYDLKFPQTELGLKEYRSKQLKDSKQHLILFQNLPSVNETSPADIYDEPASEINNCEVISGIPGESDWLYATLPQSEIFISNLASLWENLEKNYISDMGKICYSRRLAMYNMIPYSLYVRQQINKVISRPCRKQDLISGYQKRYNDAVDECHSNLSDKNKWHCEIKYIQSQLYNICDDRKREAEMELKYIISHNWKRDEMKNLVNIFISAMQVEVDRSALTFQVLEDFYLAVLQETPTKERIQFKRVSFKGSEGSNTEDRGGKYVIKLRDFIGIAQEDYVTADQCNKSIEMGFKLATKVAKELQNPFLNSIKQLRFDSQKQSYVLKLETFRFNEGQEEQIIRLNRTKAYDEWSMGVSGEYNRLYLRLQILKYKAHRDLSTFQGHIDKLFADIFEKLNDTYRIEIQSVDRLCQILQLHVEKEMKIREMIEFKHGLFFFDSIPFQYLQPSSSTSESTDDVYAITESEIQDLVKLRSQFKMCSLNGQILDRKCIYILQDFSFHAKENCSRLLLKQSWLRINENQMPEFIFNLFGETSYVDWRDFLIYCLKIRFPTTDELLDLRVQLAQFDRGHKEVIFRENFMKTHLWYESRTKDGHNPETALHNMVKIFLFELFECDSNMFNYTAFLLAFCKDLDPKSGLAKATSVVVGERVDFDREAQEKVQVFIAEKEEKCAMRESTCNFLKNTLSAFVDHVINLSEDSNKIEEISSLCIRKKSKVDCLKADHEPQVIDSLTQLVNESRDSITTASRSAKCSSLNAEYYNDEASHFDPPSTMIVYAVDEQVLRNIFQVCFPWHFKTLSTESDSIYTKHLNEVFDVLRKDTDNGEIYVCKFLQTNFVTDLLGLVHKFTEMNIDRISNELMNTSACQNVRKSSERG